MPVESMLIHEADLAISLVIDSLSNTHQLPPDFRVPIHIRGNL